MRELEQQRKGRNKNTIIDYNYISSNRYRKKFDYISNDKKLNKLLRKCYYTDREQSMKTCTGLI